MRTYSAVLRVAFKDFKEREENGAFHWKLSFV